MATWDYSQLSKNSSSNQQSSLKSQKDSSVQNFEDILVEEKSQKKTKNAFLSSEVATDFESLWDEEAKKAKEQEAKDAELARKLMEEEFEKEDQEKAKVVKEKLEKITHPDSAKSKNDQLYDEKAEDSKKQPE